MRLKLPDIMVQGIRLLPVLYGMLGMVGHEHGTHGIEGLRGEFALFVAIPAENELREHRAEIMPRGEAHLLHPHESHELDVPEHEERLRHRGLILVSNADRIGAAIQRSALGTPMRIPQAMIISRNYIPPAPE